MTTGQRGEPMDLNKIKALLELLQDHDVSQFRYKDSDYSIQLGWGALPAMAAPAAAAAVTAPATQVVPAAASDGSPSSLPPGHRAVESPMVGTFYRSPSPDSAVFVDVGTHVQQGTTLCIVEAMKLMNEIEAESAGTIVEILVDDAQPVQFGQPLFHIRPD
jgi:acetyl-CoA carboxylase biotin carboxyl carrier protein